MLTHKYEPMNHHTQVIALLKQFFGKMSIVGVEIGTQSGDLTKAILNECRNVRLYTIDPWEYREGNLYEAGHPQSEHDQIKKHAYNALQEFVGRVTILPMKSKDAFREIDEPVDFVWIDGDHTLEAVEIDIENAKKIVKHGGMIGGHDYPVVKDAVHKCLADKVIALGYDMTWWTLL